MVNRYLAIILLVAASARLIMAIYLGDSADTWPIHDQTTYDHLAQRVLAGKGFSFDRNWYPYIAADTPTSYFSTTMVLYLAAIYGVFGYHPLAARVVTALIGTLTVYLIFRLGSRLFGVQVGLLAAGIAAVYAYLVYYSASLMTETMFITAVLLALNTAFGLAEKSTWRGWLLLGGALAVAVLFRIAVLPFAFVLVAWIFFSSSRRPSVAMLVLPFLIIALAISPWTARNYQLYGRFMLAESQFGHVFWNGNHPNRDVSYDFEESAWVAPIPPDIRHLNEAEKTYTLLNRAIESIQADPGRFVQLSLNRAKVMFMFWPSPHSSTISNLARVLSFGILLPFMVYGFILSLRNWRRFSLLYLFIAVHVSVHLASWVLIRYRLPIEPLLIVFAAAGILDIRNRITAYVTQASRRRRMPTINATGQTSAEPTRLTG
jgi:4-amino-4-deoxy-L-arabinose transferase-like glycosyltransferase